MNKEFFYEILQIVNIPNYIIHLLQQKLMTHEFLKNIFSTFLYNTVDFNDKPKNFFESRQNKSYNFLKIFINMMTIFNEYMIHRFK